eukprot:TRINITY_DN1454_c0_g1_i2.p1 TRINITY_DN1454_c0_g1~~TRINITY_DN1454_c0_g1_i2.p1  ORF type:complete len:295 (-),score=63.58 TRINITY_DN1454_c0_g1_i2:32-790(-)
MSAYWKDEARTVMNKSTHQVVERSGFFTEEYAVAALELFHKYHPIEVDSTLTMEEKLPSMEQWWDESHMLMLQQGLTRNKLRQICAQTDVRFRPGTQELLKYLHFLAVPVMVLSAGLGDVIEELLRTRLKDAEDLTVVSNLIEFPEDDDAPASNFKTAIVHLFNKRMSLSDDARLVARATRRPNFIVIGDQIADAYMAEGMPYKTILRIGFLNVETPELLQQYQEVFDVVLVGDQSWSFVIGLLKLLALARG